MKFFHILDPKKDTIFKIHNQRLALWNKKSIQTQYWKDYWDEDKRNYLASTGKEGSLGEFESLFERYVPVNCSIIEAGCGPGHLVAALAKRGYSVIGIDNEPEVIRFANETFPQLSINIGDVLSIDLPSNSIDCYLSVGVLEHFIEGTHKALAEALRILRSDGILLISVPYLNPLRKKYRDTLLTQPTRDRVNYEFHQYYFGMDEFKKILAQNNLDVIDVYPYAVEAFMIREHPLFARFWSSFLARERIKKQFRKLFKNPPKWFRFEYAHMVMYVCKKNKFSIE